MLEELAELRMMDVLLPKSDEIEICRRCVSRPTEDQAILLDRLGQDPTQYLEPTDLWGRLPGSAR